MHYPTMHAIAENKNFNTYQLFLNTFDNSWEGKVYPRYKNNDPKEKSLPWEVDARANAEELYLDYNRYARETGAAKKIIKIN